MRLKAHTTPFQPGPDAFKVIPGSKLVVSRQAYKNNQSKYMINGRTSTYSEVQTLLKGRGIDLDHKRFLILQVFLHSSISKRLVSRVFDRVKSSPSRK